MRRFAPAELPAVLPVFPLPGAVLLPRGRLPLNIFEPRYLAMIEEALKTEHRMIGMVQPFECEHGDIPKIRKIGCAGRISAFSETEDGRYLVTLTGISRFKIDHEVEGFTPFRRASMDWNCFAQRDLRGEERDTGFDRPAFIQTLRDFFEVAQLNTDWDSLETTDPEMLVNSLSMLCPFSVEEKQALLEAPDLTTRRETLAALMQFAVASSGGDEGALQ